MATQVTTMSLDSRMLTDSELLASQIAQQNQAAATTLSGVGGRGNTVPPGAVVGIPAGGTGNPTRGGGGNLPTGARGGAGGPPPGGEGNPAGRGGGGGGGGGGGNPPVGGQPANPVPQAQ